MEFAETAYRREDILPDDSEEIIAKKLEKNAYIDEVEKACEDYVEKSKRGELTIGDSDILFEQLSALRKKIEACGFEDAYRLSLLPQRILGHKKSAEEEYDRFKAEYKMNKSKDVTDFYKEYIQACDDLYDRLMDGEISYEDGQKEYDKKIKPGGLQLSDSLMFNSYDEEFKLHDE